MISALGYGTMGLSGHYGGIDDDETRFKVLDRAYELGMRFWDSSDMYGDSEVLIGKWFIRTGKRNEIFLSTKFGYTATPDGQFLLRSDPEYVKESVTALLNDWVSTASICSTCTWRIRRLRLRIPSRRWWS